MMIKISKLVLTGFVFGAFAYPATAQEEHEKDWLEYFYQNPTPDRFVQQMKNWADEGILDNQFAKPALISFSSQLIRQNRDKLSEWYEQLAGLEPNHKQVLHTAMLFSRTKEADEIMREMYGQRYDEQKRETPKILELPLDKESTADMLWGFFYATGSENAIRRIVTCFRFEAAPADPDGVEIPEGYVPLYKELPDFALNSLIANGERHPRIIEVLEKLLKQDGDLTDHEKDGVYRVLSELKPDDYPDREGAEKA